MKKILKNKLSRAIFGIFLVVICLFASIAGPTGNTHPVLAVENTENVTQITDDATDSTNADVSEPTTEQDTNIDTDTDADASANQSSSDDNDKITKDNCKSSLGAIGWLVCPTTGKIAEAVDFLYEKIETFLVIDPISVEDGSPIYEVWKYCRGLTNVVFIIFLLVVIYSQITGIGINNYGVKKILPKLIVAAIMINLSFLLCTIAIDISNVIGNGIRGVFTSIEDSLVFDGMEVNYKAGDIFGSLAAGTSLAVGAGIIAFEAGAIWMLIPVILGAIVAVVTGLITIALRQAVVALLVMVAPLAFVAYILPNVDNWFKKWKDLLIKMLEFYPIFSLLFGASSLAGFAIIASAQSGFGLLLGVAVQVFPLFFSWKLMSMSGTFLGGINAKMQGLAGKPLPMARDLAAMKAQESRQKHLLAQNANRPSLRLMQFMSNRRVAREEDLSARERMIRNRGLAYRANSHYKKDGSPSKKGEKAYAAIARSLEYENDIARDQNNMNEGLGAMAVGSAQKARLSKLDGKVVVAADRLFAETVRGERVEQDNARGRHRRFEDALNVHFDDKHGGTKDENGRLIYREHDIEDRDTARKRYDDISNIMKGDPYNIQYAAAAAAHGYDTQAKVLSTKYQKYYEMLAPTKDLEYRLSDLTTRANSADNIDSIVAGLRVLNQRGDTDLVRAQFENVLKSMNGVELGTHASQALANFLMFEVKDNDPFLRRFGKYINLETARVFNENKRQNTRVTLDEYITGEYEDWEQGHPEVKIVGKSKRPITVLMNGTSLDNVERTAYANLDQMLKNAYMTGEGENRRLDVAAYLNRRKEVEAAIGPAFISASLKYLSGSEQLKNAVTFLTGYGDDGPVWEKQGDPLYGSEEAEKYYRERTLKYIKDQTPNQILAMRSDYRDAIMEHLVSEVFEKNPNEKRVYDAQVAEIQTRYRNENAEEAAKKRKKDINDLKMEIAGKQMRKILGETGKLEQIYETRRSGQANSAKDWLRKWVNLDNVGALKREVDYYRNEQRREFDERRQGSDPNTNNESARIYTETDRATFEAEADRFWDEYRDEGTEVFYDEAINKMQEWFGSGQYIEWKFKNYYENNPYADNEDLYNYLKQLLDNLDNYPDHN